MTTYLRTAAIFFLTTLSACGGSSDPFIWGDPATTVEAGQPYVFVPETFDQDDDVLMFFVTNAPSWTAFDSITGALSGTPSESDVGTYEDIVIAVSDVRGATDSLPPFSITVTPADVDPVNADPVIAGDPVSTIEAGQLYTFVPTASDPDSDALTFSVTNAPSWAGFDTATGTLSGTPSEAYVGAYEGIVIEVSDGRGGAASLPVFSIAVTSTNVDPVNADPVIGGDPVTAVEAGQPYVFTPTASDADGDALTFAVTNAPSWAGFDAATGALSGTPSEADVGAYAGIVIAVDDGRGGTASLSPFSITVTRANTAPDIGGSPATVIEAGQRYTFTPEASDPDGDTLTFTVTNGPSWASFDSARGTLSGTPSEEDVGIHGNIVITVSDGFGGAASLPAFSITVERGNSDPVIGGNPVTIVKLGQSYAFVPTASDADGDTLTFAVTNAPSWAGFDPATGALSGTPSEGDIGTYDGIVIAVSDGRGGSAALPAFSITVGGPNSDPVIMGNPATTVKAAQFYLFVPTAIDTDEDTLTFSVTNLPSWASFDTATGTLSGTPTGTDVGTYDNIVITVSDGFGGTASLPAFSITVEQTDPIVGQVDTLDETYDVTVAGGYAYTAAGKAGLQVVDVSDPANPLVIANLPTPGQALGVTVADGPADGHVYVADGSSGLQVVDVSVPASPAIVGGLDTMYALDVTVVDGYAYVAAEESGLQVVNVSDPANPTWTGGVGMSGRASDVVVTDGYAYVADDTGGLHVVDIRDPASPTIVGRSYTYLESARGVAVAGGYAYVTDAFHSGLRVVDVSNPASPAVVAFVNTPGPAASVKVVGNRAYVADRVGLQVVDVSDPLNPVQTGSADTPGWAWGVAVADGLAYVADEYAGLQVVMLAAVNAPDQTGPVGSVDTPDRATGVAITNGYAYVADDTAGVQVVDVRDPASAVIVDSVDTLGRVSGVTVIDVYAYVVGLGPGLQVVNVSDPANPVPAGRADTPGSALNVAVTGGYAYVADGSYGLQVVDVSDPASPAIVRGVDTPGWASGVAVAGGYAYVADGDKGGLQVVDVSNPANATIVGSAATTDWAGGVAVANGYAYVTGREQGGLQIVDVSDPASPAIVGRVDTPGEAHAVVLAGNYAYVADGRSGLRVVDVSDPTSPAVVGRMDTPGEALGVTIAGGYAYVADAESGLQVIDLNAIPLDGQP